MTKRQLIEALEALSVPDDTPVTHMRDDFAHDIRGFDIEDAYKCSPGDDHYWNSYCPEQDKADGETVVRIAVIRG